MIVLSAVIISKNEEEIIADCIDSLSFCDELILIDNGSTDRTVEIAKRLNAKVIVGESEDFSELRNKGLKHAKGKWVLYVDADERVSTELQREILEKVNQKKIQYNAYQIKRKNFYLGKFEWPKIEEIVRLFKKTEIEGWFGKLHESPRVIGEVGKLDGYLNHYTHRNLTYMVEKTNKWSEIEADLRFDSDHPKMTWWRFPRVMTTAFIDSYITQKGYKLGTAGLIESMFQSYSMFITYAKLWEKQQHKK
jgi:glycosyltransferase involved in cell wall biosynthesis